MLCILCREKKSKIYKFNAVRKCLFCASKRFSVIGLHQLTAGGAEGGSSPPRPPPCRSSSSSPLPRIAGPVLILCLFRLGRIRNNITANTSIIVIVVKPPSPSPPVADSRPPGLLNDGTERENGLFTRNPIVYSTPPLTVNALCVCAVVLALSDLQR